MKKSKHGAIGAFPELAPDPAGFAHALNLLLLAIGKTNPAVGALLDEFTATHAEYLGELQGLARESEQYLQTLQTFATASKLIYKRLSALDAEQSAAVRADYEAPATSVRLH